MSAEKKSLFVTVVVPWREGGGMLRSCLETKVAQIAPPSGVGAFFHVLMGFGAAVALRKSQGAAETRAVRRQSTSPQFFTI